MVLRARQSRKSICLAVLMSLSISGCAGDLSTRTAGVDYNRSFADARNDIILLNILRASAREPLQFSTISSVSGGVRPAASIKIPFTNVIAGGADAISPELSLGIRNPTVTIAPLETREFVAGIIRPISYRTIENLMTTGPWPADALTLAIGGVECSDGRRVLNTGADAAIDNRFRQVLSTNVQTFEWKTPTGSDAITLRMTAAEAMDHLDDTLADGRRIVSVTDAPTIPETRERLHHRGPHANQPPHVPPLAAREVIVTVQTSEAPQLRGANLSEICLATHPSYAEGRAHRADDQLPTSEATGIIIRSIQSMFNYLGEVHRRNMQLASGRCARLGEALPVGGLAPFRLRSYCDQRDAPINAVLRADFHGNTYFVLREEDANSGRSQTSPPQCSSVANGLRDGALTVMAETSANNPDPSHKPPQPTITSIVPKPLPHPSTPPALVEVDCDRTLITVALLTELIALQTSDTTAATSRPLIAISPQ